MALASHGRLIREVVTNRWMVVVATFFIMACAGATYNYGLYSQVMKTSLGYNQEQVNTIGFFKDLGANVGIFSGLLYDLTGPWVVLMCGAILNLVGYLMIWLAVSHKISPPRLWEMCLFICIGANSQAFTNTGVIVTSVKNFPNNRGLVIGLLKGYVGLSGAMLTLLYQALYGNDPVKFILLIAWLPCAICLAFMLVVRRMPPSGPENAKSERKIFNIFLVIALFLAGYLMTIIIVQHQVRVPRSWFQVLAAGMILIVITPLAIIVKNELKAMRAAENEKNEEKGNPKQEQDVKETGQEKAAAEVAGSQPAELELARGSRSDSLQERDPAQPTKKFALDWPLIRRILWERPPRGSDYSIPDAVFTIDMFLIFVATTCGVGGGLMAIDNLGQIGAALDLQVSTFVSLISIWNFLGRVGSGFASEIALQRWAVPRTLFFALVIGVAAIGHIIIALNLPGALFAGSIIIGLTFGAQWALMYTIISEIFGLRYYGTLYNVGGIASPLGSYILSVRVAGTLYDREAAKDQNRHRFGAPLARILLAASDGANDCKGAHCYRVTFFIMAGVCVLGCLVASVLTIRTWRFYRKIHLKMKNEAT